MSIERRVRDGIETSFGGVAVRDARDVLVITPAGRRTLRRATADFEALQARWAAALGEDGDRELRVLLRKLIGA